jgi:hypothetical protein
MHCYKSDKIMYCEPTEEEKRESIKTDAKKEISRLKAMLELIKGDDDCEALLIIDGVKHAFSSSGIFIETIKGEIKEINKAVAGKKNKWE